MKNQKIKIIFIFAIFFFGLFGLAKSSQAATYTVCSSGCTSTAIQGIFSAYDLNPDDVVEVWADTQGGGKTYTESVEPGTDDNGTPGHPIILKSRAGDTITLDGGGALLSGVKVTNVNYFTVDGFIIQNYKQTHVLNSGKTKTGVTIRNCTINIDPSLAGTQSIHGIIVAGTDMIVENNIITQAKTSSGINQGDAIAGGNSLDFIYSPVIRHNTITVGNTADGPHVDGIQLTNAKNARVYGNTISMPLKGYNYRQGIYLEFYNLVADPGVPEDFGNVFVYNNLIYGYGGSYLLQVAPRYASPATRNATVQAYIYNNTIDAFDSNTSLPFRTIAPNIYFRNNIVIVRRTVSPTLFFASSDAPQLPERIKNNIVFVENPSGSLAIINGTSYGSWPAWQSAEYDTNSFYASPLLTADYKPLSASTGVNKGTELSEFNDDLLTISRPQGLAWDIGAYEFISGVPVSDITAPAAPSGLSVQ